MPLHTMPRLAGIRPKLRPSVELPGDDDDQAGTRDEAVDQVGRKRAARRLGRIKNTDD